MSYSDAFDALTEIYLEDSWVLGVEATRDLVTFTMEFVLTGDHDVYQPPAPGEQYCYRRGRLTLASAQRLSVRHSDQPPAVDASGEPDLGNIDSFISVDWEGHRAWELSGGWGELLVVAPTIVVEFD